MTATYLACLVPVLVRGKLIHHSNVCVFAGSSYRKLMDHEIIQGKGGGENPTLNRLLEQTALSPQPCSLLS